MLQMIIQFLSTFLKQLPLADITGKAIKSQRSDIDRLKDLYIKHGLVWSDCELILVQDFTGKNVFNDMFYCIVNDNLEKWVVTGEAGTWTAKQKKKYNIKWLSRWPVGRYENVYNIGTFRKQPALKMIKQVMLFNVETGELQKGGGCHVHSRKSTKDSVDIASAGCTVGKKKTFTTELIPLVRLSKNYKKNKSRAKFNYTVFDKVEFQSI